MPVRRGGLPDDIANTVRVLRRRGGRLRHRPGHLRRRRPRPARRRGPVTAGPYPGLVFDTLSDRLSAVFTNLRGKGRLSEADIDATAREIRIALLEADVALPVVRQFIAAIKERARGEEVSKALNPAQQVIKIVNEELVTILGGETRRLQFAKQPPTVIMLAGLQGAGKTTLAGKLAHWLAGAGPHPDAGRLRPAAPERGEPAAGRRRAGRGRGLRAGARQRRQVTRSRWRGTRSSSPGGRSTTWSSSTPPAAWASTPR